MTKLKEITSTLNFKGHLLSQEVKNEQDAELFEKIHALQEQLLANEDNPIEEHESTKQTAKSTSDTDNSAETESVHVHKHQSLKVRFQRDGIVH